MPKITPKMIRDTAAWCQSEDELRETLRRAADALSAAMSAQPVAVKPLEWEDEAEEFSDGNARVSHTGSCIFGQWYMIYSEDGEYYVSCNYRHVDGTFQTIAAAKAAAQADYDARILSALATTSKMETAPLTPAPASSEPVAWRFRWVYPKAGEPTTVWTETGDRRVANQRRAEGWEVQPLYLAPPAPTGDGWRTDEPDDEGFYWVYQSVQPQSHPMQAAQWNRGEWLSSWPVIAWQPLPAAPTPEGGR